MGVYGQMVQELRTGFASGKTRSFQWRIDQLKAMLQMLDDNRIKINEALYKDLHKHKMESEIMELSVVKGDIVDTINNLSNWMKPEKVSKNAFYMMDSAYIQRDPMGVTLIIGAWNYPIQLTLLPMIGAIAAGNCILLKPSEVSEAAAKFLEEEIPKYFDRECIRVLTGGVPETTAILEEKFDLIFYTGNSAVAKIVMTAAAKHLTPVVLELGGKSPVYVDSGTDLQVVARRLSWGKFCNTGQTCIAPDYVMCTAQIQEELIKYLRTTLEEFYTKDPQKSQSYGRIVNQRHFKRVEKLKSGSNAVVTGEDNEADLYISPTVLRDVQLTDPIMQDEIFGPLLPIVPVKDHNEAIKIINEREKPLALYVFTNNKKVSSAFRDQCSSGGLLVNDTVVHAGLNSLPFGGVGNSGMGAYHGKFSFDAFSHPKPVLEKSLAMDKLNNLRYPPYSDNKLGWLEWIMRKKVKRTGVFSFFPFLILGTIFALFFKTVSSEQLHRNLPPCGRPEVTNGIYSDRLMAE